MCTPQAVMALPSCGRNAVIQSEVSPTDSIAVAQEVGKGRTNSPALAFIPPPPPLFSPDGGLPSIWQFTLGGAKKIPTMVLGCPTRRHSCSAPACSCALRTDGRDASADGWLHCVPDRHGGARKHSSMDDCQQLPTTSLFGASVCQTREWQRRDPRPQTHLPG